MKATRIGIVAAAVTAAILVSGAARGALVQDVLTVGTVNVFSGTGTVEVPIFIQDNTGTPIGRDQPSGKKITAFAMQVTYGPNVCIDTPATASQRIDLVGGILATQSADLESRVKVTNTSQAWVYSSSEANGLIGFTAAASPGDLIGKMVFNLSGCSGGTINLVVTVAGAATAVLSSDDNTTETPGNGLQVVNGAINIVLPTNTPTVTPTNTPTNTPTSTPTLTPSNTPTNTPTSTPSNTPSNTPTRTQTPTASNTPSNTPTSTPTFTPSNTPTGTQTPTASNTPSNTPTSTPTFTPSNTPTGTQTPTPSNTPTSTQTFTPSVTPTFTNTPIPPTITRTPTVTSTPVPGALPTNIPMLDGGLLAVLALLLAASGLFLSKRPVE